MIRILLYVPWAAIWSKHAGKQQQKKLFIHLHKGNKLKYDVIKIWSHLQHVKLVVQSCGSMLLSFICTLESYKKFWIINIKTLSSHAKAMCSCTTHLTFVQCVSCVTVHCSAWGRIITAMQIHNSDQQKTFLLVSAAEMSRETVNFRSVNASMKYSEIAYGQICSYAESFEAFHIQ